jgi:2-polyprenyl-3-methyl-5-hydroxy-6-metoxy-1,4-benzoquinol methylase
MLERHTYIKTEINEKTPGEVAVQMTKQQAKQYYYHQWQIMPGAPSEWQNCYSERQHPGREVAVSLVPPQTTLLEVACGIGVDYPRFKAKDIAYFGVDITPKFIAEAQSRGVPCEVGDALHLHFTDRSFDSVYCKDLLVHLPPGDWKTVLMEMARVCRDRVIILDHGFEDKTKYLLCETYKASEGDLFFYNNVYDAKEVELFMDNLGFDMLQFGTGSIVVGSVVQANMVTLFSRRKK